MSSVKITVDVAGFKEQLKATAEKMERATRPAAQEGAEIIYRQAKMYAAALVSEKEHWFYGEATKALPRGQKKAAAYGPFQPGTLLASIYQAFSEDNSYRDVSTYHVSWNADKAPYGAMVEFGTSRAPAKSFIGRAVKDTRREVRAAIKARFIEEAEAK